jgi:hypothetical protein
VIRIDLEADAGVTTEGEAGRAVLLGLGGRAREQAEQQRGAWQHAEEGQGHDSYSFE